MRKFEQSDIDCRSEQFLLAALLADNRVYGEVIGVINAGDFADPVHALIFDAATKHIEAGEIASAETLKPEFQKSSCLDQVGGVHYLDQLLASEEERAHAREYSFYLHALAKNLAYDGNHRAPKSTTIEISLLQKMLQFFDAPQKWLRGGWEDKSGARCLVGAYIFLKTERSIVEDDTIFFLSRAILKKYPKGGLLTFNDELCSDFAELREIISLARDLAEGMKIFNID